MTESFDLKEARMDGAVTLDLLRWVSDPIGFLRSGAVSGAGEVLPCLWRVSATASRETGPGFFAGFRGDKGILHWYSDTKKFVPKNTAERGEFHEYWCGDHPMGYYEGEEIPIEYVWAAMGEFIATGSRPHIIDWVDIKSVPYARSSDPFANDPDVLRENPEVMEFFASTIELEHGDSPKMP